ncbi:MAG TPA: bifunctional phosphoribosylaminoimidazolecarboxamide formyltransferase/IMP cyclohydrolase [Thermomicrobiales bacterium]|nr:bifunctional phosphoribosylaminoimidazolecarboxamide formyltransferase/IMP cyclohydrolase [Thermomicrobiales bacterium]
MSVWDKSGVIELARELVASGFDIVATGGTAMALREAGIETQDVSDVTGYPEILDGRVKTLHPAIHGALLARGDRADHLKTLSRHGIVSIDVVVSNLYPFEAVVSGAIVIDEDAIENIDIGGPAMLRAAAKNYQHVIVLVDPEDYAPLLSQIALGGVASVDDVTRRALAAKAFEHVSTYDALVASYLRPQGTIPKRLPIGARLIQQTRYGENPHQRGAVYAIPSPGPPTGVATWQVIDDREMSYNNFLDASAAWSCALAFTEQAVVIVKHTLPCGIGISADPAEAFRRALSGDPVSAFGGILATNRRVSLALAEEIGRLRLDVMIAPGYDDSALKRLRRKRNLRLIEVADAAASGGFDMRSIPGGLLVQDPDADAVDASMWRCVTETRPTEDQLETLTLAWTAVRFVKSNGIVLARPGTVVGVGAGQPNRVESVRIAVRVAGDRAAGSCLASDAFFPFPDGVEVAARAGVAAIAQPGGSVKDDEVIAAANAGGVAMMITGRRHFRH